MLLTNKRAQVVMRGPSATQGVRVARVKHNVRRNTRIAIIVAEFNRSLSASLLHGARAYLKAQGMSEKQLTVVWVPGSFEIPAMAAKLVRSRPRVRAVIALGVLIRGKTSQYQVIAQAVAQGLMQLSVAHALPVGFGIVVAETLAQAKVRSSAGAHNRGAEAACAVVAMLDTFSHHRS